MSRGTRPTPTAWKILNGNPGRRPLNKDEPQFKPGRPPKPDWLTGYASEQWDELTGLLASQRVITRGDGGILIATALCYQELRENFEILKTVGRTYTVQDTAGNTHHRPRPECMRFENAQREYRALLIELGLTPASRGKVRVLPETEQPSGTGRFFT